MLLLSKAVSGGGGVVDTWSVQTIYVPREPVSAVMRDRFLHCLEQPQFVHGLPAATQLHPAYFTVGAHPHVEERVQPQQVGQSNLAHLDTPSKAPFLVFLQPSFFFGFFLL